jgi:cytochrome b
MSESGLRAVRVWDLPTRVFHWMLAASVTASIVTAKVGGAAMTWHFRLGYLAIGLLLFRLLWGFVGGHWSRFASFAYSPLTVLRYLRGRHGAGEHLEVGHNPLGSFSVFGMLAILIAQVATGLVADDEIANVGPLNRFVSGATAGAATAWHKQWGQWIVIGLALLHLAAIGYHLLRKKNNLIVPMLGGDKLLRPDTPASADGAAQRLGALVVALGCAAAVAIMLRLAG